MPQIRNLKAYCRAAVKNLDKNNFRSNDNFYKHIDSVGDTNDLRQKINDGRTTKQPDAYSIEDALCETSAENWLLLMENERLHKALCALPMIDVKFLFTIAVEGTNQREYSKRYGISQQAVSRRWKKLLAKLSEFML